jgi:site-specific DNA-methyltransferase (adenine-specific)
MGDLKGAYAGQYEIILFGQKGRRELNEIDGVKRHTDILYYNRVAGKNQLHNHQKPVNLLQFLIKKSTNKGEIILDMFAGVRSTEIAAKLCERNYIGFENLASAFS